MRLLMDTEQLRVRHDNRTVQLIVRRAASAHEYMEIYDLTRIALGVDAQAELARIGAEVHQRSLGWFECLDQLLEALPLDRGDVEEDSLYLDWLLGGKPWHFEYFESEELGVMRPDLDALRRQIPDLLEVIASRPDWSEAEILEEVSHTSSAKRPKIITTLSRSAPGSLDINYRLGKVHLTSIDPRSATRDDIVDQLRRLERLWEQRAADGVEAVRCLWPDDECVELVFARYVGEAPLDVRQECVVAGSFDDLRDAQPAWNHTQPPLDAAVAANLLGYAVSTAQLGLT